MNASNIVVPRWQLGRCLAFGQSTREWHVWMHNQELTDKGMTWIILVILLPPRVSANPRSMGALECFFSVDTTCTSIGKTNVLDPEELQSILFHRVDANGSLWGERPSRSVKDHASNRTLLRVYSLLEMLKVPGKTWRCPNWVIALQPYCTMVPTPPPSVPEVSTIPLPQTDSIAPGLSLSS